MNEENRYLTDLDEAITNLPFRMAVLAHLKKKYYQKFLVRSRKMSADDYDIFHLRLSVDNGITYVCASELELGQCVYAVPEERFMKTFDRTECDRYEYFVFSFPDLPAALKAQVAWKS